MGMLLSYKQQRDFQREIDGIYAEADEVQAAMPRFEPVKREVDYMRADPLAINLIPPYPGASPRRLTASISHLGEPEASAWFSTEDSVDEVLSFYDNAFLPLDTIRVSHRFSETAGYSGFYELPDFSAEDDGGSVEFMDGRVHLVSAVRSGSQTHVFISNNQPEGFLAATRSPIGGIEFPAGAGTPQVLTVGEGEMKKHSAFVVVPGKHVDLVREHFEKVLPRAGWKIQEWTRGDDGVIRGEALRRGRTATVMLMPEGMTGTRVLLSVDEFTSGQPLELQP